MLLPWGVQSIAYQTRFSPWPWKAHRPAESSCKTTHVGLHGAPFPLGLLRFIWVLAQPCCYFFISSHLEFTFHR